MQWNVGDWLAVGFESSEINNHFIWKFHCYYQSMLAFIRDKYIFCYYFLTEGENRNDLAI